MVGQKCSALLYLEVVNQLSAFRKFTWMSRNKACNTLIDKVLQVPGVFFKGKRIPWAKNSSVSPICGRPAAKAALTSCRSNGGELASAQGRRCLTRASQGHCRLRLGDTCRPQSALVPSRPDSSPTPPHSPHQTQPQPHLPSRLPARGRGPQARAPQRPRQPAFVRAGLTPSRGRRAARLLRIFYSE